VRGGGKRKGEVERESEKRERVSLASELAWLESSSEYGPR